MTALVSKQALRDLLNRRLKICRRRYQILKIFFSAFGNAAKSKLSAVAAYGEPEDQLRNPLEQLFASMAQLVDLDPSKLALVGESSLAELHTRPDFAVIYENALIGYIEVKAPGKGSDPRRFRDSHDKNQWKKLSTLPYVMRIIQPTL